MMKARPLKLDEVILAVGATFILAVFSYFIIEKPIRSKRILPARKQIFICSAAAISFMALAGAGVQMKAGFPYRLPAAANIYQNDVATFKEAARECLRSDAAEPDPKGLEPCVFIEEDNPSPAFMLFGDSHAAAWAPALASMAEQYGLSWLQYTRASCPPFIRFSQSPETHPCVAFRNNAIEVIKKYDIKHICISGGYSAYIGGRKGKFTDTTPGRYMKMADFNASWEETIDILKENGVKVWIVQDVPEYESVVPYILIRAVLKSGDAAFKSVAVSQAEYERIYRPVKARIDSFLSNDVKFLSIEPPICHDDLC